ncbi:MAG: UDP-N-acetylglucosamine diphosphorylase/glucosamine-1-phosphate N-acetyltransferase [Acidobacteria bacterium]|nr:UDP-N-acetylglucosamine diphosphorylase/glucosamine-1-phosphate N-acetyltransferase [Acidobacteriota bacterium]
MQTPVTILILAAGLGTRMRSRKAKVLHQAGGRPLIERVAETALEVASPGDVFVVVGRQAEEVCAALEGRGVGFIHQAEQGGTGHAVMVCREQLAARPGLLAVLYGDCPLLAAATVRELIARQAASSSAATVITTTVEDPTGYGRVLRDQAGCVGAIVEQKAASPEVLAIHEINSGIYCFRAELLWAHLDEIRTNNPAREYYLTDIVAIFRRAGHLVQPFHLDDPSEVLGINTRAELAALDRLLRERKARELMLAGVTLEKPETVIVDEQASAGMDTLIEPFAQIRGRTRIGEDCRIGAGAILRDAELGDGVEIGPYTLVQGSRIDSGARVGPYARLRMGAHVEAGAQVGNFVEMKKTRLGAGSKSMHLAYLGDADIGPGVNIGAGSITCNYDGERKHETRIGEGVFVGSNATLVAPLEIGEGSYIGAGSTVTDPVPPGALALGRARQVNKPGWARKRRKKTAPE